MGIKLNLYSNGQIAANKKYLDNMDKINWGPGHIERDGLGIPVNKDNLSKEKERNQ